MRGKRQTANKSLSNRRQREREPTHILNNSIPLYTRRDCKCICHMKEIINNPFPLHDKNPYDKKAANPPTKHRNQTHQRVSTSMYTCLLLCAERRCARVLFLFESPVMRRVITSLKPTRAFACSSRARASVQLKNLTRCCRCGWLVKHKRL